MCACVKEVKKDKDVHMLLYGGQNSVVGLVVSTCLATGNCSCRRTNFAVVTVYSELSEASEYSTDCILQAKTGRLFLAKKSLVFVFVR